MHISNNLKIKCIVANYNDLVNGLRILSLKTSLERNLQAFLNFPQRKHNIVQFFSDSLHWDIEIKYHQIVVIKTIHNLFDKILSHKNY